MFSKIDKKILTIALAFFVVVLVIGFLIYKNFNLQSPEIKNSLGGTNIESNNVTPTVNNK